MWERFGYYLMLGILFLYLTDSEKGGMGLDKAKASDIVGTYLALVYLTPFLGGLLADRVIGYRRAIFIGGALMSAGYLGLAIPGYTAFWISLLLIIVGNGFFKPNISTLLGNLYNTEQYRFNKDSGYSIFYMGINLGAFICNFVAAYMRNKYGWGYAFGAAGIGMIIGLIWFLNGTKHIKDADIRKPANPEDMPFSKVLLYVFLPAVLFGGIGWFIPSDVFGSDSTDAFIFASIPVIAFFISLWWRASKEDKEPIAALLAIFAVAIVFWAVFKQNASALTAFAESYTDRQIPEVIEPLAKPLGMVQTVTSTPDSFPKMDEYFRPEKDEHGHKIKVLSPHPYLQNLEKPEWPAEGDSVKLFSTEIYQSVNPFFIILLTPLVVGFFSWLRKRGKEPSLPAKISWSLFITALSAVVMVAAVLFTDITADKATSLWLIGSYFVITIGELFLSPVGLSLVSKLSPARITSLMMGGWFLATSIGNKLSGVIAGKWDKFDNKAGFFMINVIICLAAVIVMLFMVKWLRRVLDENAKAKSIT